MNTLDKIDKMLSEAGESVGADDAISFTSGLVRLTKLFSRATQNNNKILAQEAFALAAQLVTERPIYWRKVYDAIRHADKSTQLGEKVINERMVQFENMPSDLKKAVKAFMTKHNLPEKQFYDLLERVYARGYTDK